jgi:AcrR family transcriptional regulator
MGARSDPRVARSRAAALRAALELLVERGVEGATIDAVAERPGVAKTTIYRQWPDRAALALDAFGSALASPPAPDTGTLRGDLLVMDTGLAHALSIGDATQVMVALIDAAQRDPAFAVLHRREAEKRHAVVLTVLERGIARGELPAGTDPADVLDLITGPLFHRRLFSGKKITPEFARHVVDAAPGVWTN